MTVPAYSGCVWPLDTACEQDYWDALDETVQDRAAALATEAMRHLTGYRVGGCPVTVRPCQPKRCHGAIYPYAGWFLPTMNVYGQWINFCGCTSDCSCSPSCEVSLPRPVVSVTQVKVDGVVVDPADYGVAGNKVVWVGSGDCPWPYCQDIAKPDTEDNTFSITYLNSYPVDSLGAYAAGVLAVEFAKACSGTKCRLPAGTTQVVRQGVSYSIVSGAFPNGLTGIREIDSYIQRWNPARLSSAPSVWVP